MLESQKAKASANTVHSPAASPRRQPAKEGNQARLRRLARETSSREQSASKCAACSDEKEISRGWEHGTRSPTEELDDTGTQTPAPAPGVTPPTPPPPPAAPAAPPFIGPPAPAAPNCGVSTGPSYSVSGTVPVTNSGGRKRAPFSFTATFATDTTANKQPACCQLRQYIKWDAAYAAHRGGPPHSGFPSGAPADTWIEDRDTADKRYGHRSGTHSDPIASCGDEYTSGGTQDMANGDSYCGRDSPYVPASTVGTWQFQLKVVDTCNGDAVKASSGVITVPWG